MLNFYDFEVFKHDWLVVFINPTTRHEEVIVNDKEKLENFYNKHKDEMFIGYNSRGYDQYILKGILCGFDPYDMTEYIIGQKKKGWQYSKLFNNFPLNNYDTMPNELVSLKSLEAFMGNNIKETSVPFNIERKLTSSEIEETIKYCKHDVEQTIEVFMKRKSEFDTVMFLIKEFKLPMSYISKTKQQIIAAILGGNKKRFDDEFDYKILPCVKIKKYTNVLNFFKNAKQDTMNEMKREREEIKIKLNESRTDTKARRLKKKLEELNYRDKDCFKTYFYSRKLETKVAGVPHVFAFGGIHGADEKPYCEEGIFLMADVEAYYPSMAIRNGFGKRVMDKWENFELIHKENIRLKHIDKVRRYPFKIADNGVTGQLKDETSSIYDPMANNCICINGQLMLLDLIERLEEANAFERFVQSNTDGILIKLREMNDYNKVDDIVYEWECRTGMKMEFELYKKVYQGDVNNYILVGMNGKVKSKGAYVKQLGELDNDLPIVNRAITEYIIHNTPVEKTINECDDMVQFQKVVKVSNKYMCGIHNGKKLNDKTFRVFASKDKSDTFIGKQKNEGATVEKFANTPENCFIINDDIRGMQIPSKLDKRWYIAISRQRLKDKFGVNI